MNRLFAHCHTPSAPRTHAACVTIVVGLAALLLTLLAVAAPAGALGLGDAPDLLAARASLEAGATTAAATVAAAERAAGLDPRAATSTRGSVLRRADALCTAARTAERARLYTRAYTLYKSARALYLKAGSSRRARTCLTSLQDVIMYTATYSETRNEMLATLTAMYPSVPAEQRAAWLDLPSTESLRWDGVKHYYYDLPTNLAFRNLTLFQTLSGEVAMYTKGYEILQPYLAKAAAAPAWQPYAEPREYDFTQTLAVPRDALPATGDLRAWLPLPIVGGPQSDVRITNLTSSTWCTVPPSITQNIGLLYLHVPLDQLSGDLELSFDVHYSHAAQYFKVQPSAVGTYDTSGTLYRRYTTSRGNTAVTPSIRRTARRVVGSTTNPYSKARRLYRYVISQVKYSYTPHLTLWPRGIPESVYVHRHKYGDCGAQGMYFAALCRAVGVPARCTGGYQTIMGSKPGGHFWAEFYLPNYGWIPVDPSVATIVDYVPNVPTSDRVAFHNFFFGNQDDMRLVVQKDTDLPLIPRANMRVAFPAAIQTVAATCPTTTDVATFVLGNYWNFK